jgi:hypothetical protein
LEQIPAESFDLIWYHIEIPQLREILEILKRNWRNARISQNQWINVRKKPNDVSGNIVQNSVFRLESADIESSHPIVVISINISEAFEGATQWIHCCDFTGVRLSGFNLRSQIVYEPAVKVGRLDNAYANAPNCDQARSWEGSVNESLINSLQLTASFRFSCWELESPTGVSNLKPPGFITFVPIFLIPKIIPSYLLNL